MTKDPIVPYRTPSDGLWLAKAPDLPGCSAHGETPEAALGEIKVAMRLWIGVADEDGTRIPPPTPNPSLIRANGPPSFHEKDA